MGVFCLIFSVDKFLFSEKKGVSYGSKCDKHLIFIVMKLATKMGIVAVAFAVPAFLLGRVIWPDSIGSVAPTASQLPFFIFLSVLEAVAFGIGIAFLFFGWDLVGRIQTDVSGKRLTFVAAAWLLVSWWPHDNMHRHNGEDLAGLLQIEYIFHFTLIIAAFIIARQFWKSLSSPDNVNG